jgi:hypothetical protein
MYWCLYGDRAKKPAWKDKVGKDIIESFLIRMRDQGDHNLEQEAVFFEGLLTQHTGKSIEEWEKDYKEWILDLPVEPLGERKGSRFVSQSLSFEVTKPTAYSFEKESALKDGEVVAFSAGTSKRRRIVTSADANWEHAELSEEMVGQRINSVFDVTEMVQEPVMKNVFGNQMVESVFVGKRRPRKESAIGENAPEESKAKDKDGEIPMCKYRVTVYCTPDKVYLHMFEVDPEYFDKDAPLYDKYLEQFKVTYVQPTKG